MDNMEIILGHLQKIETTLAALLDKHTMKERYTTAEVAAIVGKAEYTVREWCRKGQTPATKAANGRGWLISHQDLLRLRNEGPIPEQHVNRVSQR